MVELLRKYFAGAPVTFLLSAAILAVYLVTAVQSGSLERNWVDSTLAQDWILFAPEMHDPVAMLRAVGSMFIHLGATHMALNLFMLGLLGPELERAIGSRQFAAGYFIAGLGGSLAVMFMDTLAPTAGASGALYGLMAFLVALAARRKMDLRAPLVLVAVNVVFSLVSGNVSLWGHLGGLIAGAIVAWPLVAWRKGTAPLLLGVLVVECVLIWVVGTSIGPTA